MVLSSIGGLELFLAFTISGIIAGVWVYRDARRRQAAQPALWATAVGFLFLFYFVVGIAALIGYLLLRPEFGPDSADQNARTELVD